MLGIAAQTACPKGGAEVFVTTAYNGTGASLVTYNGVDFTNYGGMVWIKSRTTTTAHKLTDTIRGVTKSLMSDANDAAATEAQGLTAVSKYGFTIGTDADYNDTAESFVAWAFRVKAGFFDIVAYTGTGVAHTEAHTLGAVPGMIIVKDLGAAGSWYVYHRSNTAAPETDYLLLDTNAATADLNTPWNDTAPTSAVFTVGTIDGTNKLNDTYIAYLFGHDTAGSIQCGTYTGNGSKNGPTTTLGWEPQWLLVKKSSDTGSWYIYDNVRSTANPRKLILTADTTNAESSGYDIDFNSTGFQIKSGNNSINESAGVFLYMAIRK